MELDALHSGKNASGVRFQSQDLETGVVILFSWFSDFYRQSGTVYFANHFHLQHFIQRL